MALLAANRLGTSTRSVRRIIAERRITFTKIGRHVRLDTADLDAFIASGRVVATARDAGPRQLGSRAS